MTTQETNIKTNKGYKTNIAVNFIIGIFIIYALNITTDPEPYIAYTNTQWLIQKLAGVMGYAIGILLLSLLFTIGTKPNKKKRVFNIAFWIIFIMATAGGFLQKTKITELQVATDFKGFYLSKTRGLHDYCKTKGIDLSNYVKAYNEVESIPLNKATTILVKHKVKIEDIDTEDYSFMLRTIETELEKQRAMLLNNYDKELTVEGICNAFNSADKDTLKAYSYEKEQPEAYKRLMSI